MEHVWLSKHRAETIDRPVSGRRKILEFRLFNWLEVIFGRGMELKEEISEKVGATSTHPCPVSNEGSVCGSGGNTGKTQAKVPASPLKVPHLLKAIRGQEEVSRTSVQGRQTGPGAVPVLPRKADHFRHDPARQVLQQITGFHVRGDVERSCPLVYLVLASL